MLGLRVFGGQSQATRRWSRELVPSQMEFRTAEVWGGTSSLTLTGASDLSPLISCADRRPRSMQWCCAMWMQCCTGRPRPVRSNNDTTTTGSRTPDRNTTTRRT
ncbi:MAG: hypothetical protein R2710_00185 [Acidimicrobiales bacterium]